MSPNIFKGALGSDDENGARYKPGSGEHDSGLAGDLVALYSSGELRRLCPHWAGKAGFRELVEILEPRIASQADITGLDADLFLEDLASCILRSVELTGRPDVFSTLLDPVMQVLYNHGHDELTVNFSLFPPDYLEVGGKLEGERGRVLRMTYKGTFEDVGFYVKHVRLELYGTSKWAGPNAHSSEFILHEPVRFLGLNADGCTYHLLFDPEEDTLLDGKNNSFYFHKTLSSDVQERIRLKQDARRWLGERDILTRSWGLFFNRGNRIFIPKGEDGWEEIVPYDP